MERHAMPLVNLFFGVTIVTYRMPCHASGHLVIYCKCYRFERQFFTLRYFLPYTPSCRLLRFPRSQQFNLNVSRASCWSSKHSPGPTINLNHNNPWKTYGDRFYLSVMAWPANEESASYRIQTLFKIGEHVRSLMLYLFGHRALQSEIN